MLHNIYAIFVFNVHPINRISKAGAAIVNAISSLKICYTIQRVVNMHS